MTVNRQRDKKLDNLHLRLIDSSIDYLWNNFIS